MGVEILVPLAFFSFLAAIIIVPTWLRSRERRDMQATLRNAIDKGQPLPPEMIEALSREQIKPPSTAHRDLRRGVVLLAVAVGIALFGVLVGYEEGDATMPIVGGAAIPGMIGLAFIVLSFFNKNRA